MRFGHRDEASSDALCRPDPVLAPADAVAAAFRPGPGEAVGEGWRPDRTWVAVLLRARFGRVPR